MNKTITSLALTLLLSSGLALQAQITETNSFLNLNQSVPDGNAAGLHDVRNITSAIARLLSVRLKLRIIGEFNGDLYSYVRQIRGGTTNFCVLLNRVGRTTSNSAGYADLGLDVVLDDAAIPGDIHLYRAVTNLPAGTPLKGSWKPDGRRADPDSVMDTTPRTATLSSFTNQDANGEWTLYVADLASGGTNMLAGWELDFTGVATPTIIWPAPADIVYGTPLTQSQLNASSTIPGTLTYNPPTSAMLNAGSNQTLTVVFTPTDTNSYVSVTNNVSINVLKHPLTITAANTSKVYGAALPLLSASYSGFVNGDDTNNLGAPATLSTSATAASDTGTYPITVGNATSANYAISYVAGTLTISQAGTSGSLSSSGNPLPVGQPVVFTLALTASAPGAGIPTGSAQFVFDGTNASGPVALSGGVAVYSTSTLAHGFHSVAAQYAGDGNFTGTTNLLSPAQLIDTPPMAGPVILERESNSSVKVSVVALLANCSDADGDLITFLGASASSANGGTVASNSGWIFYTPAPGFTNIDTFTYSVSDGYSVPISGTVTVNIDPDNGPSPNLTIIALGNGSYSVLGDGIPGRTYRIEFAESVPQTNWQDLGTATADDYGVFTFTDTSSTGQRFYRSVYP
jgi:subtilisin-like proprotein convertase family protein